jgi:hypothetical protein
VSELEHVLGLARGTIARIILLGFHKVCARWVPRTLSEDNKAQRKVTAHSTNNMPFMFTTSSNAFSLETRHGSSSLPGDKTCKLGVATCRVTAIEKIQDRQTCWQSVFGRQGCTLVDFMGKGTTINAVSYCATLERLQTVMKQRPGLLGYNRCFASAR